MNLKSIFKAVVNTTTNTTDYQGQCELVSIAAEARVNTNGKNYKPVTLRVVDTTTGEAMTVPGLCYEGNYSQGVEVGKTYLTTLRTNEKGSAYFQMSHLESAPRVNITDLGFSLEDFSVSTAKAETKADEAVLTQEVF